MLSYWDRMRLFIVEAWFVYTAIPLVYFEKSSQRVGWLFSCARGSILITLHPPFCSLYFGAYIENFVLDSWSKKSSLLFFYVRKFLRIPGSTVIIIQFISNFPILSWWLHKKIFVDLFDWKLNQYLSQLRQGNIFQRRSDEESSRMQERRGTSLSYLKPFPVNLGPLFVVITRTRPRGGVYKLICVHIYISASACTNARPSAREYCFRCVHLRPPRCWCVCARVYAFDVTSGEALWTR